MQWHHRCREARIILIVGIPLVGIPCAAPIPDRVSQSCALFGGLTGLFQESLKTLNARAVHRQLGILRHYLDYSTSFPVRKSQPSFTRAVAIKHLALLLA